MINFKTIKGLLYDLTLEERSLIFKKNANGVYVIDESGNKYG